jgi:hypothetical protein
VVGSWLFATGLLRSGLERTGSIGHTPQKSVDLTIRQLLNPSQRWIRNSVGSRLERMCEEGFKSTSRSPAWWGRFFGSEIFASRPGAFTLPQLSSSALSNN